MIGAKQDARSTDWLIPFLLIFIRDGHGSGRELAERVSGFEFGDSRSAAVYRALRRLENEGMVRVAAPEPGAWPLRRRYEITEPGEAYLHFWADALEQYREEMDAFLRLYERSAKGGVCGKA